MIKNDFYEEYGKKWSDPIKEAHETACSETKLKDWIEILPDYITIQNFIDFGCGNGTFVNLFANHYRIEGIGIDISKSMIENAESKYPDYKFFVGEIDILKKKNIESDILFYNDVLEHVSDINHHLEVGGKAAPYIGIRIPVEKTWFIALMNKLKLKKPISQLYYSDGHLYEFSRNDIVKIIQESKLEIIGQKKVNDLRQVIFHPYIKKIMKEKRGKLGAIRYGFYLFLEKMPYSIVKTVLQPIKGYTMVLLCKSPR